MAKNSAISEDKKWEAEDALRTLKRAEEIKKNKDLMKRVLVELKKEEQAIINIKDLPEEDQTFPNARKLVKQGK
jgi:hypothetical protein